MNGYEPDSFEKRLQRQTLRPVPPSWREEILSAARDATPSPAIPVSRSPIDASLLTGWMRSLLWPHPRAWAGLAAVWLALFVANIASREPARQVVAARPAAESPQRRELLRQQEQLLAELVGPLGRPHADRPKPAVPQPRSQRRIEFRNA
jgi:hypothetical protein